MAKATLYNFKTKKYEQVDEDKVESLISEASHGFQEDIDVPVTSPSGEVGTVPAKNMYEAVKQGFRYQRTGDLEADTARKQEAIDKKHYGNNSAQAFAAAALRSNTLGVSDAVMSIAGEGVKKGLDKLQKYNPKATFAGEMVGLLSPSGLATSTARAAVKGASKTIAKTAATGGKALTKGLTKTGVKSQKAQKIGKTTQEALEAAGKLGVEGAVYGAGAGVSETALGDPADLATNIMSAGAMGALFGAGFGAVGKVANKTAAPIVKEGLSKTKDFVEKVVTGGARKLAKASRVTWSPAVREKYHKAYGDIVDDPDMRRVWDEYGPQAYEKTLKEASKLHKTAMKQYQKNLDRIKKDISTLPKKEAAEIDRMLLDYKGDLPKLVTDLRTLKNSTYQEVKAAAQTHLNRPAQKTGHIIDDVNRIAKDLKGTDKALSKEIGAWADTFVDNVASSMKGKDRAAYIASKGVSEGDEFARLWAFDKYLNNVSKSLKGEAWHKVTSFQKKYVKSKLANYDKMGDLLKAANKQDQKYKFINDIYKRTVDSSVKKVTNRGSPADKKFLNIMRDPGTADEVMKALKSFDKHSLIMKRYHSAAENVVEKNKALKELQTMINTHDGKDLSNMTIEQVKDYVEAFGKGKIDIDPDKMQNLRNMMDLDPNMTPMTAAMHLKKLKGEDVSSSLQQMVQMEEGLRNMYQMAALNKPIAENTWGIAKHLLRGSVGSYIAYNVDPRLGILIGGYAAAKAVRNPTKVLNGLGVVEKWSNRGAKAIDKKLQGLVDTIANPKLHKFATKAQPWVNTEEELKDRRAAFKQRSAKLTEMTTDPNKMAEAMGGVQESLQHSPETAAALNAQMQSATQFLNSKLPQDPFVASGMAAELSDWEPTDQELAEFERYVDAAQNPSVVLDKVIEGNVTPEEIETLQVVYPSIYGRLQETAMNAIVEHGDKIPYDKKVMLGVLLDIPTDYSLTPDFIEAMQVGYQAEGADEGGRPQGTGKAPNIEPKEEFLTEYDKITYGVNR